MQLFANTGIVRFAGSVLVVVMILVMAGCGFRLAGEIGHLPAVMRHTCIRSGEPYGELENLLRSALRTRGEEVSAACSDTTAQLQIVSHSIRLRVLAVNNLGQPVQYLYIYRVVFALRDARGKTLLAPTTLTTQRQLAYAVTQELGVSAQRKALLRDMQRDVSQLILLRLEALHPGAGGSAKN